jgi:hypothetical protein
MGTQARGHEIGPLETIVEADRNPYGDRAILR